jgi:hypothetical protein
VENSLFIPTDITQAESELPPVMDLSDTIAAIQILFMELGRLDPIWGVNHGGDCGVKPRFDGWRHPVLVDWAMKRGHCGPLPVHHYLDGPELYVLQRSLEKKLASYQQGVLHG